MAAERLITVTVGDRGGASSTGRRVGETDRKVVLYSAVDYQSLEQSTSRENPIGVCTTPAAAKPRHGAPTCLLTNIEGVGYVLYGRTCQRDRECRRSLVGDPYSSGQLCSVFAACWCNRLEATCLFRRLPALRCLSAGRLKAEG